MSALLREVPLFVLGDALYGRPDLAWSAAEGHDLDRFWKEARPAPAELAGRFRRAVMATALIAGDFYRPGNRETAARGIAERIEAGLVVAREREAERHEAERRIGPVATAVPARAVRARPEARPRRRKARATLRGRSGGRTLGRLLASLPSTC